MTTPAPEHAPFTKHNGKLVVPSGVKPIIVPERGLTDDDMLEKKQVLSKLSSTLFEHLPQTSDVVQGSIGDCYLLASLVSILEMTFTPTDTAPPIGIGQRIIENMMVVDQEDPNYIIVRLYDCRIKKQYIPCYLKVSRFAVQEARLWNGKKNIWVTGVQTAPWVSAIEQAYAAFNAGAAVDGTVSISTSMEGGFPHIALPILLGGPAEEKRRWDSYSVGWEAGGFLDFMKVPFALQKKLVQTTPGASSSQSSSPLPSDASVNPEWDKWKKWYTPDKRRNWDTHTGNAMLFLQNLQKDKAIGQIARYVIENIQSQIAKETLAATQPLQQKIEDDDYEDERASLILKMKGITGDVSKNEEILAKKFLDYSFLHHLDDELIEEFIKYFKQETWEEIFESYYSFKKQFITNEECIIALQATLLDGKITGGPSPDKGFENLNFLLGALKIYLKGLLPSNWQAGADITYTQLEVELFSLIVEARDQKRPVVASSRGMIIGAQSSTGVPLNHALSILNWKAATNMMVLIRNPWNKTTPTYTQFGTPQEGDEAENWVDLSLLWQLFTAIAVGPTPSQSAAALEVIAELPSHIFG